MISTFDTQTYNAKQQKQHFLTYLDNIQYNKTNVEDFLMNNRELKDIIEEIQENEELGLNAIAEKAKIDRSYLSTFINAEEVKTVTDKMLSKFKRNFPEYFHAKQQKQHIDTIDANLKEILRHTRALLTGQTADHQIIMRSLDRLEKNPEGTLSELADKLAMQIQQRLNHPDKGMQVGKRT